MPRPTITATFNWMRFEQAVLSVFTEALNRLANVPSMTQGEESINFELYRMCRQVHLEQLHAKKSIPFFILFDSTNQPEFDDTVRSHRLRKRPDFGCALMNPQATDLRNSQVTYWIECKRLGHATGKWIFTENYSAHGMLRFRQSNHGYAKGSSSAAMIGFAQSMQEDTLLEEVNKHAAARAIPSLSKAGVAWAARAVTPLSQDLLTRDFGPTPIQLRHLWLDLRHVTFTPAPTPTNAKAKKVRTITKKKATAESVDAGRERKRKKR